MKHPMAHEVTNRDPDALIPLAEEIRKRLIAWFGAGETRHELHAFICMGEK